MLKRVDIVGNPNIGVFILATDDLAIVPYNLLDEKADIIKEALDVDVVKSSISGCSLIGSLAVANSNGMVVSPHVLDREIKQFEDLGINVATVPGQYTALGNIVAANDKGAIVSPFLSEEAINVIEETLDVNVEATSMVGSDIIGSMIQVTNKGFLISSKAIQSEISFAQEVFGVEGDIGTVGRGISLVGACSIANSNGAIVAKDSTGPEMARVEETKKDVVSEDKTMSEDEDTKEEPEDEDKEEVSEGSEKDVDMGCDKREFEENESEKKFSLDAYIDTSAILAMLENETEERRNLVNQVVKEFSAEEILKKIIEMSKENELLKSEKEFNDNEKKEKKFSAIMASVKEDLDEKTFSELSNEGKELALDQLGAFENKVKAFAYEATKNKKDNIVKQDNIMMFGGQDSIEQDSMDVFERISKK